MQNDSTVSTNNPQMVRIRIEEHYNHFLLVDHNGHVWLDGRQTCYPVHEVTWNYLFPGGKNLPHSYPSSIEAARGQIALIKEYEVLAPDTPLVRCWIKFRGSEYPSVVTLLTEQAEDSRAQVEAKEQFITLNDISGDFKVVNMQDVTTITFTADSGIQS